MSTNVIPPGDVHSPKAHWNLIAVLDEGAKDRCALALGRWDGDLRLALRWNGDEENPIGNPQSRGIPTWFIIPEKYNEALLESGTLTADRLTMARGFFPQWGNDPNLMDFYRNQQSMTNILQELDAAGSEKQFDPNQHKILELVKMQPMRLVEEVRGAPESTYRITDYGRSTLRQSLENMGRL